MASEVNHHVGYSRENECWFVRFYPYQTEQQASEAAAAFTRPAPAATDTGLETVGWLWEYAQYRTDDRGYYGYETVITESNPTDHVSHAEKLRNVRELVTRQNVEEVIAAKDAQIAELEELLERTDRFAKKYLRHMKNTDKRNEALEADNKRLREALDMSEAAISEFYRYWTGGEMRGSYDGKPERDGLWKAMYKARAALGEVKP